MPTTFPIDNKSNNNNNNQMREEKKEHSPCHALSETGAAAASGNSGRDSGHSIAS